MSKEISVSDDYVWTAGTGLYQWVIEYLQERVPDRALWEFVEAEGFAAADNFFVSDLPEPYRRRVLDILAQEVPKAYATRMLTTAEERERRRGVVGLLEILAMMAAEVRRELDQQEQP